MSGLFSEKSEILKKKVSGLYAKNKFIDIGTFKNLNYIKKNNNYIEVGATTPLIDFELFIKKYFPDFVQILKRFGSIQIRNVCTIAGNIATASPIGDTLPLLLSLDSQIIIKDKDKTRILPLNGFFISYRKTKLKKGQFIHSIRIPLLGKNIFKAYKISKRIDDDISSVCASFNVELENNKIKKIKVAYGGMANIPKRAVNCEKILLNSPLSDNTINKAKKSLEKDFKPITDVRASQKYRMEIAKNLLEKYNKNDDETWSTITTNQGSVEHLDFLTRNEKDVFKTAFELDQKWIVELAADRTPFVSQAQSINIFLPADVHKKELHQVHFQAWKKGLKSLYYCRSKSIQRAENINKGLSTGAAITKTKEDQDNEECLSCQ